MKIQRFASFAVACGAFLLLTLATACQKDSGSNNNNNNVTPTVDCSKVTGATFSSNSGQIANILGSRCGSGSGCHGSGSRNTWVNTGNYDEMSTHFSRIYSSAVLAKNMPPAGSPQLSQTELDQLQCWKNATYPK